MKRTIIALFLVFSVGSAHAQWSVTPEAGIAAVKWEGLNEWRANFKVGIAAEYAFNDLFSVESGLHLMKKNSSYYSSNFLVSSFPDQTSSFLGISIHRSYLQLPALAKLGWKISDDIRITLAAGPYLGYRVKNSPQVVVYNTKYDGGSGYNYGYGAIAEERGASVFSGGRKLDWGGLVSAGIEVKNWVTTLTYDLSLGKEFSGDKISAKCHTISLSAGYKFKV